MYDYYQFLGSETKAISVYDEHGLALLIQEGFYARSTLDSIDNQLHHALVDTNSGMTEQMLAAHHEAARSATDSIREGDRARLELIGRNLHLVTELALASVGVDTGKFGGKHPAAYSMYGILHDSAEPLTGPDRDLLEDRFSVACCGLIKAVKRFTPGRKGPGGRLMPFGSFAKKVIKKELEEWVRVGGESLPDSVLSGAVSIDGLRVVGAANEETEFDDDPVELPAAEVIPSQLDTSPEQEHIGEELGVYLDKLLGRLPERSAAILRLRMGFHRRHDEYTLHELSKRYGLSPEGVRYVLGMAEIRLGKMAGNSSFQDFQVEDRPPPHRRADGVVGLDTQRKPGAYLTPDPSLYPENVDSWGDYL